MISVYLQRVGRGKTKTVSSVFVPPYPYLDNRTVLVNQSANILDLILDIKTLLISNVPLLLLTQVWSPFDVLIIYDIRRSGLSSGVGSTK